MIVDPENTFNYDLVNALQSENKPKNQALDDVAQQYLISNNPSLFVEATYNTQKAYHGLEFGYADTMNFLYPMDSEPEGYFYENHIIKGNPVYDIAFAYSGTLINTNDTPEFSELPEHKLQTKILTENFGHINPTDINEYIAKNGYSALAKALFEMEVDTVHKV